MELQVPTEQLSSPARYRLDVARLVDDFGGITETAAALNAIDPAGVSRSAIEKCCARRALPLQRVLDLMLHADRKGRPFDLRTYLVLAP
jgi:hypothetical protein